MLMNSTNRVLVLFACTLLGLVCGTLYLYSSFSPQLAERLQYSVTDSSVLALVGTAGVALSGPVSGSMVDRKGYAWPLLMGGAALVLGYKGLQIQYDRQYSDVRLSGLLLFMVGVGSTFINLVSLKCCAVTFPSMRGLATSLPLALYGLSALFYSSVCSAYYANDTSGFLRFLLYSILFIFGICAPIIMYFEAFRKPSEPLKPVADKASSLDSLLDKRFLLLFVVTGLLAAFGQMYIYSVGYIIKALTRDDKTDIFAQQQLQVGLISITNFLGRIAAGILSDALRSRKLYLLYLPSVGFFVTHCVVFDVEDFTTLSLISLATGFMYGFTFCLMPIIVGEMFGMADFSLNWGVMSMAPILPSYYLTALFGQIYDSRSIVTEQGLVCPFHKWCYNAIFKITLPLGVVVVVVVLYLNLSREHKEYIDPHEKIAA